MRKTIYVAIGLAVVGGATFGVPGLVGHGEAAQARERSVGLKNAKQKALVRVAGMRRNYEAIRHLVATIEYEQVAAGKTTTKRFLMRYARSRTVYFEDLSYVSSPPAVGDATVPRLSTWTDGREIRIANQLAPGSAGDVLTGEILPADGTNADWRGFGGMNPLSAIRGDGPVDNWEELQSEAESGHTLWARPEAQFGAPGFAFLFNRKKGLGQVYYWIDDVHGFIPRIIAYRSGGKTTLELRVGAVAKAAGAWLPTRMTRRVTEDYGSTIRAEMRVLSFDANTKLSPKDLEFRFKPGTLVSDHIRETQYRVGPG